MHRKKSFAMLTVLLLCAIALSACGGGRTSHTSALLTIKEKSTEGDHQLSITAYNSFSSQAADSETWKIRVDEENTWNLIEPGGLYLISYTHDSRKKPNEAGLIEAELEGIKPASDKAGTAGQ
ncbi:hypothetical protein [Saccharibacillus alkalitolerans]|uniref:Uncharacterized protein n=1 Tax=Saccharibacillus alkalitolerans TaxID=2705290 RepID=A0ABX0F3K1_9BACL|nr:hypothetical protein [Saccharibacillus alkalitolerans]NGZ75010.1 hypothetical protein [Saccharibacillus alkalitolerans]